MKAIRLGSFALVLFFAAIAPTVKAQKNELKFFMSPRSNVPQADVLRNLNEKCPGATIVLDPKKSDYMLEAFGWSGSYKFVVFKKGGEAVYSTNTVMLSNSVKDVCKYVTSHSPAQ
jgi:hypothetical protein